MGRDFSGMWLRSPGAVGISNVHFSYGKVPLTMLGRSTLRLGSPRPRTSLWRCARRSALGRPAGRSSSSGRALRWWTGKA
jgi:hypothetical protein